MMIGAMSQKQLVGFQLLHSNFNREVFANFIYQIAISQTEQLEEGQQLVLFMDNYPTHRYRSLMQFCSSNNIILLYNLPRKSELNLIEYLWEYLKRPLRFMINYKG